MVSGCPIDSNVVWCLIRYQPTLALILSLLAFMGIYGIHRYKSGK